MPLTPAQYTALEGSVNRLAAESMFATAGRDDGLVPSYSLVGEIREICASEPALVAPVNELFTALDRSLDNAQPFTDALLGQLRSTVEWLNAAIDCIRRGTEIPPGPLRRARNATSSWTSISPRTRNSSSSSTPRSSIT